MTLLKCQHALFNEHKSAAHVMLYVYLWTSNNNNISYISEVATVVIKQKQFNNVKHTEIYLKR